MTAWQLQATTTMMILTKDNLTFLAVTRRTQRYALLFTQLDRERNRETCRTDELPKDNFAAMGPVNQNGGDVADPRAANIGGSTWRRR